MQTLNIIVLNYMQDITNDKQQVTYDIDYYHVTIGHSLSD